MTELLTGVEAPSDAELISRVRGGDVAAYGELFARHVEAARRLGRQLVRGPDVDDLVSDAFAKTLNVLQNGGGPDVAFRAYLLTSLRRLHVDKIRAAKKVQPSDDMTVFDDGVPFTDTAVASFDNGAAAKAFASLPERWQLVLWHLEVEGQKPADIAPLLGMTPNSVSALAYRAREGLRQAFLTMHLADTPTEQCRWVNEHLGAYVRKGLSKRDTTKVEGHLDECRRCTAMYLELNEVNSNLAGIIAPLLLGAAAAGYVSSAGGAGVTGVSALFGRVRDAVSGNGAAGGAGGSTAAAAGGAAVTTGGLVTVGGIVAATVAVVTAAAFVFGGGAEKEVITEADQPIGIVQTPAPGASEPGSDPLEGSADSPEAAEDSVDEELADQDAPFSAATDGAALEPGGTADSPADEPGTDTPPASGDTPPADEPGTDGPGADGPGADQPGTEEPAPPASENPGTDTPGTDTPPATDPPSDDQPADPAPTQPGGTDGTPHPPAQEPTPTPSPTTPLVTSIQVTAHHVVDGSLSLTVGGADAVASIRVRLSSAPADVAIESGAACAPASGDWWLCSPTAATTSPSFVARILGPYAATAIEPYAVNVPLAIPRGLTELSGVTFEYILPTETDRTSRFFVLPTVPVANISLTDALVESPEVDDEYLTATGMLDGIPEAGTPVTYTLTGDASWATAAMTTLGCTVDAINSMSTCPAEVGSTDFYVVPSKPEQGGSASIRVSPLPDHLDGAADDNVTSLKLPPMPPNEEPPGGETPSVSAVFSADTADGPNAGWLRVVVRGTGDRDLTFQLSGSGQSVTFMTRPAECTAEADADVSEMTCSASSSGEYVFLVDMPPGQLGKTTLTVQPEGDVPMSVLVHAAPQATKSP